MPKRFEVQETWGYREPSVASGGNLKPPGLTASVHDRAYLHHVVALYRSEDYVHMKGHQGMMSSKGTRQVALALAETECARLNAKYPEGFPSE